MSRYSLLMARVVVSMVCGFLFHVAYAIDIEVSHPPQRIDDRQMKIGVRVLQLPEGSWTFVAKKQDHTSDAHGMNKETRPQTFTAYAMSADEKIMRAGIVLKLPTDSHLVTRWTDEPCLVKGFLYKDDFQSSYGQSQCLLIFKRKTHLTISNDAFYGQAKEWLREKGVGNPGPVYEVQYFRFASNEYGWVRVFIPQSLVVSEEAVVEYAKRLPDALTAFFEKRVTSAVLPSLPLNGERR